MFARPKGWLSGTLWKPKNPHSLEHLKFLYSVLCKNQTVTEQNKSLLVETLRSISEILIWGDQNDSSVFDFFLEKNMLAFFLRFMRQKFGRYICVQLLQTLNILFENISNETSVYYLLSNNHINSIIVHKFDFSDEEVMAYYISFLKTLSLKLNKHTIHFFYNEHTNDFALYTEAIKFFNHPESMVRIAVRTITLNVYKACRYCIKRDEHGNPQVDDKSMLRYIRDKTAAPYFSNLVWFIGNHIIELDSCVRNDADHNSRDRLADLVAEHLDHLHYLNDILCLAIDALNEVLTDHLINRLLIPLYVYSLTKRRKFSARTDERPHVSSVVSLFLLSQVFLIISHPPLVRQLADIIFNGNIQVCMGDTPDTTDSPQVQGNKNSPRGFVKPPEPLAQTLESNRSPGKPIKRPNYRNTDESGTPTSGGETTATGEAGASELVEESGSEDVRASGEGAEGENTDVPNDNLQPSQNSTDEEKLLLGGTTTNEQRQAEFSLVNRPYLEAIFNALECTENDYEALFALCLLYAMGHNIGINEELLDAALMPTDRSQTKDHYNIALMEKLIQMINLSCQTGSRVRLATLEMSMLLLKQLVFQESQCFLQDRHLAAVEGAREESTLLLRNFYKSEEIFLDMFEDEFREMRTRPLNVEYLMMDASVLLPPTGTPLTGIDFNKRLPCGEVERARRAIRVFFLLRDLSLTLRQEEELALPLTKQEECVKVNDVLDLNNSDLIACTVITRDTANKRDRRFLVIDLLQLILVKPDTRRLGWGVVKFVGFLQDVEVTGDKDDSRSLHITIHKPSMNMHARPLPLLSARFIFDDHIRCMAAKQRLTKGRLKARQRKMQMIARLLELPVHIVDSIYQAPQYARSATTLRAHQTTVPGRSHIVRLPTHPGQAQGQGLRGRVEASAPACEDKTASSSSSQEKDSKASQSSPVSRVASQPIPIQSGRSMAGSKVASLQPGSVQPHQGSPEVEQAEEATPSPEAHAFQSLNSSALESSQELRSGHGSRSSSSERPSAVQEIPLEDMSRKLKSSKHSNRSSGSHQTRDSSIGKHTDRQRVSQRQRADSLPLASDEDTSSSVTLDPPRLELEEGCDDIQTEEQPHGVSSSETESAEVLAAKEQEEDSAQECKEASDAENANTKGAQEQEQTKTLGSEPTLVSRSRSSSGSGPPPSLTPATAPAVSLTGISPLENSTTVLSGMADSLKLLPPVEPEDIRHLSDTSSMDSEGVSSQCLSQAEQSPPKSRPPFAIEPKCSTTVDETPVSADIIVVEQSTLPPEESASDHLSRMAQLPQYTPTSTNDSNDIPLSPKPRPNATDDAKEQHTV